MPMLTTDIPLSLYIHLPWCVRKCPYCDFNSHALRDDLPEILYVEALAQELDTHLPLIADRAVHSIFFGGGTPSLFSGAAIERILNHVQKRLTFVNEIEITLEANPGTIDQSRFQAYREAGVNRLSIGVQSFQDDKLTALGRIHHSKSALQAVAIAKAAHFDNFNLDIMYALPDQSIEDALADIETALQLAPTHFSWYQLTLEPNTLFYHQRPSLPDDEVAWEMQQQGQALITQMGYQQYEVSAYAKPDKACKHNRNYWEFGDYLGIGAGAHSKISTPNGIMRSQQIKHPKDYLMPQKRAAQTWQVLSEPDLIFEFMLNGLRLTQGISHALFTERTGVPPAMIAPLLQKARARQFITDHPTQIVPTSLGARFLNDLVGMFLPY